MQKHGRLIKRNTVVNMTNQILKLVLLEIIRLSMFLFISIVGVLIGYRLLGIEVKKPVEEVVGPGYCFWGQTMMGKYRLTCSGNFGEGPVPIKDGSIEEWTAFIQSKK